MDKLTNRLLFLLSFQLACDPYGHLEPRGGDTYTGIGVCDDARIEYVMTCTFDGEHGGKTFAACPEPVPVTPDTAFAVGDTVTVVYAVCATPGQETAVQMAIAPNATYHAPDFF